MLSSVTYSTPTATALEVRYTRKNHQNIAPVSCSSNAYRTVFLDFPPNHNPVYCCSAQDTQQEDAPVRNVQQQVITPASDPSRCWHSFGAGGNARGTPKLYAKNFQALGGDATRRIMIPILVSLISPTVAVVVVGVVAVVVFTHKETLSKPNRRRAVHTVHIIGLMRYHTGPQLNRFSKLDYSTADTASVSTRVAAGVGYISSRASRKPINRHRLMLAPFSIVEELGFKIGARGAASYATTHGTSAGDRRLISVVKG